MHVRVGLVAEVRVSYGQGWSIKVGEDAWEADPLFKAVVACRPVAVGACVSGWVFGARVTLLHVILAFSAD